MRTTGESSAEPVGMCLLRCSQSCADARQGPSHQLFRPGEADPAHRRRRQPALDEGSNIFGLVRALDRRHLRKWRGAEVKPIRLLQQLSEEAVLG